MHVMRNEIYYSTLTIISISFITPFQKNRSKTRWEVRLTPMCPDVRSTWHAFKMRHLSSLLLTYLTTNTSCLIEVINAWMPYRARDVYIYLLPSRILFGFFCRRPLHLSKCCSLSSDDSFFVAGTTLPSNK